MPLDDHRRRRVQPGLAGLVLLLFAGCTQAPAPVVEGPTAGIDRLPVVFVPGVTGVGLRDTTTDELVWGKGANLLRPHDRGVGTARSLSAADLGPQISPAGVILNLRLFGLVRFSVYEPLVDLFVANGYQVGDLEAPRPRDDFFLFSYDWRQDNVASAARLAARLEELRRVRGQQVLKVQLICQSNGAHVCRYFTKYGGLNLEEAESGRPRAPKSVAVDTLILVGASNGGSIRVLRELNRGRRYVDVIGRRWAPETLFTYESLFQDLPVYTRDLFVDGEGQPVAVDLFDAENWQHFQWSIFGEQTRRQLEREDSPLWLGSSAERQEYLARSLVRARRFHKVLQHDMEGFPATRYHLITNMGNDTSSRAVLRQDEGVWQTGFADDKWVLRNPVLRAAVVGPGDGHATAVSQLWLSPQEERRLGDNTLEVAGSHRRIILEPATQRRILRVLLGSTPPDS